MSRNAWLWTVVVLIAAALAATFFFASKTSGLPEGPAPTPFGWTAQLRLVAGDGVRGMRNGPVAQARFDDPYGVAAAEDGTLYVADAGDNNRIRRIGSDGVVTTLAGFAEGFADGDGTAARFNTPSGLALDRAGNLYVADTGNHAIRKVTPLGMVSTVAGNGMRRVPRWRRDAGAVQRSHRRGGGCAWQRLCRRHLQRPHPQDRSARAGQHPGRRRTAGQPGWRRAPPPASIRPPRWRWMRRASSGSPTPATTPSAASRPMARW